LWSAIADLKMRKASKDVGWELIGDEEDKLLAAAITL
jgi:hypothetical protein